MNGVVTPTDKLKPISGMIAPIALAVVGLLVTARVCNLTAITNSQSRYP